MSQEMPYLQQIRDTSNNTLDVLLSNLAANIGSAYGQANTSYAQANSAYAQANLAYTAANNGISAAATALSVAEAAYGAANSGISAAASALSVAEAAYATANVGISNSGVSAGTYGSGSQIPRFTVDARGRVTSVTTSAYNTFTSSTAGIVNASGGGTTNFLRADGSWAVPVLNIVAGSTSALARGSAVGIANDPELILSLQANHSYVFEIKLYMNTNAAMAAYAGYPVGYYDSGYFGGPAYTGSSIGGYGNLINYNVNYNISGTFLIVQTGVIHTTGAGSLISVWGFLNNGGYTAYRYAGSSITAIQTA